jgi:hypothetical protein
MSSVLTSIPIALTPQMGADSNESCMTRLLCAVSTNQPTLLKDVELPDINVTVDKAYPVEKLACVAA